MNDTYSCPECGGDRDTRLTPMTQAPSLRVARSELGRPCSCTQHSRTSGAFGEMFTLRPV